MSFAWPWMFALLPLPLLVWWLVPAAAPGAALHLPQPVTLAASRDTRSRPRWRVALALLAWLLVIAAAARPQQMAPPQALAHTGRSLMLAVDCSGSMAIEDMRYGDTTVSRFAAVKAIAQRFIRGRSGDDVGLVLFGTQAYLLTPMTFDVDAVAKQLQGAAVGLAGRETAIGDAITLAVKHLTELPARARVLVLLTDGVNNAGSVEPLQAARLAKAAGVRIYTIGVGSSAQTLNLFGMQLPMPDQQLDVGLLTRIASMTGGQFFRAGDGEQLAAAYRTIDQLEPLARGKSLLRPNHEWYPWPLGLALLLGVVVLPWSTLWRRRIAA